MTAQRPPRFSIITPVFNPPRRAFSECIESVLGQTFADWEWCLADDRSTDASVAELLDLAARDPRVRVIRREHNGGIVAASNSAAAVATGEFLCFLDHDDLLSSDALATVIDHIAGLADVDYVYSDEDKISENGEFYDRFWKPDWSPERLLGHNYCSHLSVVRRSLYEQVGGLRAGFDGSQDYDLILRVTERARRIVHIPEVLYHWRAVPGSTALEFDAKPYAFDSAQRALADHMDRLEIEGEVTQTRGGFYRVRRAVCGRPKVSIVIPTIGSSKPVWGQRVCLVTNAVQSIVNLSTYEEFEVVLVHDFSTPRDELDSLRSLLGDRLKLVEYRGPFDFARQTNLGALHASGEVIVMLNDDTQVITPDWLEVLVGHLQDSGVGMVGPMLLLADGRIQSAGHYNVRAPHHLGAGAVGDDPGPFGLFWVAGERTGVTAACAALRRDLYLEVGGLSSTFPRSFNDVDLGNKLRLLGYRIVWTPHARLYHFESLSRDPRVGEAEVRDLYDRWSWMSEDDQYARGIEAWWTRLPV